MDRRNFLRVSAGAGFVASSFPTRLLAADMATFPIGCISPMSGTFSELGKYTLMGSKVATDEVPELLKWKVQLINIDSEGNPGTAVRKLRDAFGRYDIRYISGAVLSSEALALNKEMDSHGGVSFLGAGADEITGSDCNKSSFRWSTTTYGVIEQTVKPLAKLLPKAKRWYTITPQYVFGDALLSNCKSVFKELGVEHVGNSYHSLNDTEFSSHLLNAMATKPDVLVILSYGTQCSATVRQAVSFGVPKNAAILVAYSEGVTQIRSLGKSVADGVYFGLQYWHETDAPLNKNFVEAFRKKYNVTPPYASALSYISTKLVLDGIYRASSADPSAVIKALEGYEYDGPTGREKIRAFDHQCLKQYYLAKGKPAAQVNDADSLVTILSSGESTVPISQSLCKMNRA